MQRNYIGNRPQQGFTLVEIAIVLVIIGILLAGVLKGQSLITNGRIKGLVNNMNAVSSAYNAYIDRYQVQPGTEALATLAARGWTQNTIGGTAPLTLPVGTTFLTANDQTALWQSLGAAGFFAFTPTKTTNPASATGGVIGVAIGAYGSPGVSVCLSGVTGQLAAGVDTIIDGPLPATNVGNNAGSLLGASNNNAPLAPTAALPAALAYSETSAVQWTLCRAL